MYIKTSKMRLSPDHRFHTFRGVSKLIAHTFGDDGTQLDKLKLL